MKHKKLFFLILTFFLILFFSQILMSISVRADGIVTDETSTIRYDWLSVNVEDPNPNDNFKMYSGGYDLLDAVNLGSIDHGEGKFTFRYRVKFGFEVYYFTSSDIKSIYPKIDVHSEQKYNFLTYRVFDGLGTMYQRNNHYVTYDSIDLGSKYNDNLFDENVPITVSLNPDFQNFGGKKIGDIEISGSDYVWKPKVVEISNYEDGEVGNYQNIINPLPKDETWVDITVDKVQDDAPSGLQSYVADKDLGARRENRKTVTRQNYKKYSTPKGTTWSNQKTGDFTFEENVLIRPEVMITRSSVRRRYLQYDWNSFWTFSRVGNIDTTSSPDIPYVIDAVHVQNYFIHKEYETSMVFECNVDIENWKETENLLNRPAFSQGDWIWSNDKGGTDELILTAQKAGIHQVLGLVGGFMPMIIGLIVFIVITVGIVLAIKYGLPVILGSLIKNKINKL